MWRWNFETYICSWCTTPTFDYIHTSLSNFSGATELQLLLNYWETESCGRREMKRSRWWAARNTKRARSISLQPLDSLLSTGHQQSSCQVSVDEFHLVTGLGTETKAEHTHRDLHILLLRWVKIFVIIESCDNLTNSKYWSSTYIQS